MKVTSCKPTNCGVCLESREQARNLLYDWQIHDLERGQRNLARLAEALGLDALERVVPSAGPAPAALCRPGHGAEQSRTFLRQSAGAGAAADAAGKPGPHAGNAAAALQHQPVLQRSADRQSRLPRHAAHSAAQQSEPAELLEQLQAEVDAPTRTRRSCGPFAAFGSGNCCASAPTTSSATGRWKRSPATSRASPTPPSKSPWTRPGATSASASASRHASGRAGPLRRPRASASSAARSSTIPATST